MKRITICAAASLASLAFFTSAMAKPPAEVPADAKEAISHAKMLSRAFRAVSGAVAPAVVSIQTTVPVQQPRGQFGMMSPQMERMLRQRGIDPDMFGGNGSMGNGGNGSGGNGMNGPLNQGRVPKMRGEGTGFVIAEEGYILTNNHVVKGADSLTVNLSDGRTAEAKLVGIDAETDIAIIKVDLEDLTPLVFADSDAAQVGDWVIALGSPFGLADSVTAGIISAKGRQVGLSPLESYLQTDATINPGNSGGPLVDMDGKVVGINTAIESRSGGSDGIGFAIPANLARGVVDAIMSGSTPSRGYLGVGLQGMDEDLAASFNFKGKGVLVSHVQPESPAEAAGMHAGDIITKVNGEITPTEMSVHRAIRLCAAGSECPIDLVREGKDMKVTAHLGDRAKLATAGGTPRIGASRGGKSAPPGASAPAEERDLGMAVAAIDDITAKEHNLKDTKGLLVTEVARNGLAERAGLRTGDVIRKVGDKEVSDAVAFKDLMNNGLDAGKSVRLLVEREGETRFVLMRSA